jgi:hypothetical protein
MKTLLLVGSCALVACSDPSTEPDLGCPKGSAIKVAIAVDAAVSNCNALCLDHAPGGMTTEPAVLLSCATSGSDGGAGSVECTYGSGCLP